MVAGILIAYPGLNIAIGGYTDNVGTGQLNQGLSEERAGGCARLPRATRCIDEFDNRDRFWQ